MRLETGSASGIATMPIEAVQKCWNLPTDVELKLSWVRFLTLVSLIARCFSHEGCDFAQSRCVQNPDCLPVLRRYLTYCSDIIDVQEASACWPRCRRVVPLLLDQPDGLAFMRCDCGGNVRCLEQRQRLETCSRGFDSWLSLRSQLTAANGTVAKCSVARKFCSEDEVCDNSLSVADLVCARVLHRGQCGKACRNSLRTLYLNDIGSQLVHCRCDEHAGAGNQCDALQLITRTVCKRQRKKSRQAIPATKSARGSLPMEAVTVPVTREISGNDQKQVTSPSERFDSHARIGEMEEISFNLTSHAIEVNEKMVLMNNSVSQIRVTMEILVTVMIMISLSSLL